MTTNETMNANYQNVDNTKLNEYIQKYTKYMEDLDETISDVYLYMREVHCPQWIRTQLVNSYDLLLQKKRDYEDIHRDILKNSEIHQNVIERFIQQF